MNTTSVPILLVDDRHENLVALAALLDDMGDLEIVSVTSGEQALQQLLIREFGLVLMDVQMPGMDGFETAALIRATPKTREVPIIFVTARMIGPDVEFRGYESGAVDYLVKPIEPIALHAKVRVFVDLYRQRQTVVEHERYMAHVTELVAHRTGRRSVQDEQLRVLLVDDHPENLVALHALLSDMDDLVLIDAQSGPDALRATLRDDFAVILLDVQMPGMDGFETAALIRGNPKTRLMPIIFVTAGMKEWGSLSQGYETGAIDYLIKPLEPVIVRSKVQVFCELYRHRRMIERNNIDLEVLAADRMAALQYSTTELHESRERYRRLAEKLDLATRAGRLGIWDWNTVTNELAWDARMIELYGMPQEHTGRIYETWLTAVHPDDRTRCDDAVQRALRNEQPYDIEFRIRLPDGTLRHIKADGKVVFDAQGKPQRMTGINYDITERKQAEEQLRQLNERLEVRVEEKTQELRRAMEQIVESEKLASLGGIVAGVAHELNTPIGNIVMTASTLEAKHADLVKTAHDGKLTRSMLYETADACKNASSSLVRNAMRASDLIESFKKVAVDQTSQRRRTFDLRDVVLDILNTLGTVMRHAKVTNELRIPSGIQMDSFPGDLEQILNNLIMNSIHHGFETKGGGHIVIDGSLRKESIEIIYQDDGVGIAPELHRKVFEPFYTTRLGQGGSGLGMFIVHNLIHGALHGDIRLESAEGTGVRFTLIVPAVTPAAQL